MPLNVDSIKIGMWITVVKRRKDEEQASEAPLPWFGGGMMRYVEEYSGLPVQVKAISLPFLAIWTGHHMSTLDTRAYDVVKVDKKYVDVLINAPRRTQEQPTMQPPSRKKRRKKEKIDPTERCIRCGDRLIQKHVTISKDPHIAEWHYYCRQCGYDGGKVS